MIKVIPKQKGIDMRKTILFNPEAIQMIEEYMKENNTNFNRAVNNLILSHKETESFKLLQNINRGIIQTYKEVVQTHEEVKKLTEK